MDSDSDWLAKTLEKIVKLLDRNSEDVATLDKRVATLDKKMDKALKDLNQVLLYLTPPPAVTFTSTVSVDKEKK